MRVSILGLLFAVAALSASSATAALLGVSDFESPYTLSDVDGQGASDTGWNANWSHQYATHSEVSTEQANGGSNSMKVRSLSNHSSQRNVPFRSWDQVANGSGVLVTIQLDLYLAEVGAGSIDIYGMDDASSAVGPHIALKAGSTASTAEIYYRDGSLTSTEVASGVEVNLNEWNTFAAVSNMDTGTYDVLVNGSPIVTGSQWRQSPDGLGRLRIWSALDDGTSYVDNVVISATPEPAALGLLSLIGVAGVVRRRR